MSAATPSPAAHPATASLATDAAAPTARPRRAGRPARVWPLGVLLALVAANWLLWASAVPVGEAPDEPSHVEIARFVAEHGRLPAFGPDADLYVRLDQVGIPIESHALAPPLTYLVDGALIRLLPLSPVTAARIGSLLAALATVILTYWLGRILCPHQPALALPVAALVAAVPQLSFQAAVANSDVFALAAVLAAACLWPRVTRPFGALTFGVALGAALLAKYTAYPALLVVLLAATWQARRSAATWRGALSLLSLVVVGASVVAGPWLVHNWRLYGEPWPLAVSEAAFRALTPAIEVPGAPAPRHLWDADYLRSWATITFRSFWAGFGHVDLFAPTWVYASIVAALAVAAVGLARSLTRSAEAAHAPPLLRRSGRWLRRHPSPPRIGGPGGPTAAPSTARNPTFASPTGLLLAWPAATLLATVAASLGRYYPVHGRYLLVLLPLVALALVLGWRAAVPARWRPLAPWALVAGMTTLNAYCLLGVVVPHYYGPAATRVTVTMDSPRPGDLAAESLLIRGWAVVSGRTAWQPGVIGGAPAWHAPAASVWVTVDGAATPSLSGGAGVQRPDVARALDAPLTVDAGFAYTWDARGANPGVRVVEVCAADSSAAHSICVLVSVHTPE